MDFTCEATRSERMGEILRAQLNSTICLAHDVRQMELRLSRSDKRASDLLRSISRELSAAIERINSRASQLEKQQRDFVEVDGGAPQSPFFSGEDSLEALLNRFCRYERNTSARLGLARGWNDGQTVVLLDHILSIAGRSIRFLDIYSCVLWLECEESNLPSWKPLPEIPEIADCQVECAPE